MAVAISGDPRPVYDLRVFTVGQSLAQMIGYTHEGFQLYSTITAGAVSPTVASLEIINRANGGAGSCLENHPAGADGNYYCIDPQGTPTPGQRLTDSLAELAARVGPGTLPQAFLFDQGQDDVTACAGLIGGLSIPNAIENYALSWEYAFAQLQAALGGSGPIPIYIMLLGRAAGSGATNGYDNVRKTQISRLLAISNTVLVATDYDMALVGNVHPDRNWQSQYGQRFANAVLHHQLGATPLWTGPTITSISLVGAVVEVHIAAEAGDTITLPTSPLGPWGFKFLDGTTPLGATFLAWNGNNPKFTLSATPADLHMNFIDDYGSGFDPLRLIIGRTSTYPLQQKYL